VAFVVEFVEAVGVEVGVLLDLNVLLHCRVEGLDGFGEAGEGDELGAVGDGGFFGRELCGDVGALEPEGESGGGRSVALGDFGEGLVGAGKVFDQGEVLGLGVGVEEEVGVLAGFGAAVPGFLVQQCRMWDVGCRVGCRGRREGGGRN
jgi:hypothetical protein